MNFLSGPIKCQGFRPLPTLFPSVFSNICLTFHFLSSPYFVPIRAMMLLTIFKRPPVRWVRTQLPECGLTFNSRVVYLVLCVSYIQVVSFGSVPPTGVLSRVLACQKLQWIYFILGLSVCMQMCVFVNAGTGFRAVRLCYDVKWHVERLCPWTLAKRERRNQIRQTTLKKQKTTTQLP